ncbi:MAG: MerR family transcriptional regulator [Bacteroidia bacterium]|nr:MerR family transcriptional regulator [Bacteroidia bacterium]
MATDHEEIEKQYYSIGEVSEMLDVNPSLIRFWESEFDLLKPKKNRKGNRIYTLKDIELIKNIYFLVKEKKYTLAGAAEKLRKNPNEVTQIQKTQETLVNLREFLVELKNAL